jgi:PAS domain S-box-containing protein
MELPVRIDDERPQLATHGCESDDGVRARILLVDDHAPNLVALEEMLAPLGQELVRADSGRAALRELLKRDFALILMDVQMPQLDGIETAALIRNRERNRSVPIIFLTAIADDPALVFRGYLQGAVDYLLKPFDPQILRSKTAVFVELWKRNELIHRQQVLLRAQEIRELQRRNEQRFRSVIDTMPTCVWVAHADGEIAYCNRMWREYAGADAGMSFFDSAPADEVASLRAAWDSAIRDGQTLEREQRLRRADGHYRWHLLQVVPEKDARGMVLGWIATSTDIDHHKRVEEAHAALLAREQQAREQAEVANRTKDEFLATVSHELRTPLNAILGWTRILKSGATRGGDGIERVMETIERNARVQAQLIEDLLDVSRIIAGKLRVEVRPIDLVTIVHAAVDAVHPAANANNVDIELRLPPQLPLEGDADRLQQVVWNLLSNAIKFAPGGRVTVEARRDGRNAEVVVTDTGIGISKELLVHIFERFRQASPSTTRAGGLGLGLAIVRHLVEVHGGSIVAESDGEARGSRFTIRLPVREVRVEPAPDEHEGGASDDAAKPKPVDAAELVALIAGKRPSASIR